ncbi:hypothetical protein NQZ68_018906 [Dissostichus eleginoides]|nr:hypothetical protein NQZ68_018906 [Dissostichus eleginoides]
MNIATLDAIQTAKYAMKSRGKTATMMFKREDEKLGPVDRTLCRNMRSAARRDKAQREERLVVKGRRRWSMASRKHVQVPKRAREQESKRAREQESKRARGLHSKRRKKQGGDMQLSNGMLPDSTSEYATPTSENYQSDASNSAVIFA